MNSKEINENIHRKCDLILQTITNKHDKSAYAAGFYNGAHWAIEEYSFISQLWHDTYNLPNNYDMILFTVKNYFDIGCYKIHIGYFDEGVFCSYCDTQKNKFNQFEIEKWCLLNDLIEY